jgi:hypothetical protein
MIIANSNTCLDAGAWAAITLAQEADGAEAALRVNLTS